MAAPDFSEDTKLQLAFRSALICNNPDCGTLTVGPSDANGALALKLGEAAHIRAARGGQARYDSNMNDDERASFENGIWLCASCHTLIDKNQGAAFPTPLIQQWKVSHEAVLQSLLHSHRSPLPMLRRFTEEGMIAQEAVDTLERHGALFVDMIYEVDSYVRISVDRLRGELQALPPRVQFDVRLKQLLKDLYSDVRDCMNATSRFPQHWQAELEALRRKIGIRLVRLRDEFGCRIHGPIVRILP